MVPSKETAVRHFVLGGIFQLELASVEAIIIRHTPVR